MVYLNVFENYAVQILRLQNTESGEPEPNKIGDKCQVNDEFILYSDTRNTILNQITDTVK